MGASGRTAFVTGASSGIGRDIARGLAEAGARVVLADIDEEHGREIAGQLAGATFVRLDVADARSFGAFATAAAERVGPVDILVNCAGGDVHRAFAETDEDLWDDILQRNLLGVLRTTRLFLPSMMARGHGRVVNVASEAGRIGTAGGAVYSGAKGGVIAFTKAVALEAAHRGVTANSVCPGPTDTPGARRALDAAGPEYEAALVAQIPLGRLGRPSDVTAAVLYFASDEACFVTGQTLSVNGGRSML